MPWKSMPEWLTQLPDWLQVFVGFSAMLFAAMVGAMAKIADDVKSGHRERFWTIKLFLEIPAVGMMALIGWGLAEYYTLSSGASVALGAFLGWAGPKTVEAIISMRLPTNWRK